MTTRLRQIIAWWQIVCGALGIAMLALLQIDLFPGGRAARELMGTINIVLGMVFFVACVAFGIKLHRGDRIGYAGSLVCQVTQAVSLAILNGPHVAISAGPHIALTIASDRWNVALGFNAGFFVGTRIAGAVWEVTINLLALVWAFLLLRALLVRPSEPVIAAV